MRRYWFILIVALVLLFLFARQLAWLYTDWLWFKSLGYSFVFWTKIWAKALVGLCVGSLFALFIFANFIIARRLIVWRLSFYPPNWLGKVLGWLDVGFYWVAGLIALYFGLLTGLASAKRWEVALQFLFGQSFGVNDPIFGKDISFYLFRLPFWRFLYDYAISGLVGALALTASFYAFHAVVDLLIKGRYPQTARSQIKALLSYATPKIRLHLFALVSVLLLVGALHFRLGMFELLYGKAQDEIVWGAGYTDLHIRLVALWILTAVFVIAAFLIIGNLRTRTPLRAGLALVGVFVVTWLVGHILPRSFQRFIVKPNELTLEKPYLSHNIQMTRLAYGIDDTRLKVISYPFRPKFSFDALERNKDLLASVRLWDYRWLKQALTQLQSIRTYYDFTDVDVDRYTVNGVYRQIMLSARELNSEQVVSVGGSTWINRHLQYTHGYGVAVVPVNEAREEGEPLFWVKDIPPNFSFKELKVNRPEIYFGELTKDYVITNTRYLEFDYPKGERGMVKSIYKGKGGISIENFLQRLAFSLSFNDPNFLLTRALKKGSRLLFRRNIHEVVRYLAPFLVYDADPYLVIADGKLFWICDAYTVNNRFPYSEPIVWQQKTPLGTERILLNYIRNSVKVVIDAYDGTVHFYIADEKDVIIRTYRRIFPDMFHPISDMPKSLRRHLRYPQTYFSIQAEKLKMYHMIDPEQFYLREDLWNVAQEDIEGSLQEVEPYYVMMRLPTDDGLAATDRSDYEFVLLLPFTPKDKPNLIALLAGRCDEPNYGELVLLEMPRGKYISGTAQVDARINQDTFISQQLTLWGQRGSTIKWGTLLVIPLNGSLLYIKPLFLVAEQTKLPELKRVVIATQNKVLIEDDLKKAIAKLIGRDETVTTSPTTVTSKVLPVDKTSPVKLKVISEQLEELEETIYQTEESARKGDWAKFGENLNKLRQIVQQLRQKLGKK